MGTILQFAERLSEDGDWTPAERSQLRDMGAQLGEAAAGLDLVFGKTEEGDPWCVVADDRSEVLLHVARIGGGFVVHAPRNDQVIESADLWAAVSRVLGGILRDRRGIVLPFAPDALGQPAALALMLAAAVRGDFDHALLRGLPSPTPDDRPEATPMPALPTEHQAAPAHRALVAQDGQDAAQAQAQTAAAIQAGVIAAIAASHAQALPQAQSQAQSQAAPLEARGPVHTLTPVDSSPFLRAPESRAPPAATAAQGAGNASAGGGQAPAQPEAGNGTATDNAPAAPYIEHAVAVQSGAVARGVTGTADAFVMTAPVKVEGSLVISLGVVTGFSVSEGDRLVFSGGLTPAVVEVTELSSLAAAANDVGAQAGRRIGYDLNGDGREDAFVTVVDAPAEMTLHKAADTETAPVAPVVGAAPAHSFTAVFIGS